MSRNVVTRFAPSPTGFMHVGSVRTALYAWLFARQHGGRFILRIEDTDKEREIEGSIDHIVESLTWLGLTWDEGPILQSSRLPLYHRWAMQLYEKGFAYADPLSEDEVAALREKAEQEKRPFLYREHRPENPPAWDGKQTLRFKVPEIKRYVWRDIVRGELSAGEEALDDFILLKNDGYPTYNFAHIIDDHEMGVTHIMRGEEFISSTPKFLSLYDALGIEPPQFATMPVILGPDGKKKLSKRDGAKDILEYRDEGIIPEAFINFLALLGWHPTGDIEVLTRDQLVEQFSLERLQKAGARFDEAKLHWFNHEHLSMLSDEQFANHLVEYLKKIQQPVAPYIFKASHVLRERAQTLGEAAASLRDGTFDFFESVRIDPELLCKGASGAEPAVIALHLTQLQSLLEPLAEQFTAEQMRDAVFPYAQEVGKAQVLWPLRVALSGKEKSPDPFTLGELLGKQVVLERIVAARAVL